MIIDKFDNIQFYNGILPNLENGLQAIKLLPAEAEIGKYEFEGGFFMVQEGETKPIEEGDFEAHRKYVDVQIVLEGKEEVAWADIGDLQENGGYNENTDKAMYQGKADTVIEVLAGMCYVAFPQDAHKAIRYTKQPGFYKKIVMKLPVMAAK